jgi:DNA replication protein DnaC
MMAQQAQTVEDLVFSKSKRRVLTRKNLERMRLPRRFYKVRFDSISRGEHCFCIESYLTQIGDALKKGFGMVIWGANAVGKTSVAALCLKESRRIGKSGLFITANQYIADSIGHVVFDDAHNVKERCLLVDLLVLDDLGKESANSAVGGVNTARMFEDLLRERSASMRSTIVTMNISPKKLEDRYGKSFAGLLSESTPFVEMVGPSQRKSAREDLKEFFATKG